jgi:hypothetical protein
VRGLVYVCALPVGKGMQLLQENGHVAVRMCMSVVSGFLPDTDGEPCFSFLARFLSVGYGGPLQ